MRLAEPHALVTWMIAAEAAAAVATFALLRLRGAVFAPAAAAIGALLVSGTAFLAIDRMETRKEALAIAPWLPDTARAIHLDDRLLSFEVDTGAPIDLPCTPRGSPASCAIDGCSTLTLLREGGLSRVNVGFRDCH